MLSRIPFSRGFLSFRGANILPRGINPTITTMPTNYYAYDGSFAKGFPSSSVRYNPMRNHAFISPLFAGVISPGGKYPFTTYIGLGAQFSGMNYTLGPSSSTSNYAMGGPQDISRGTFLPSNPFNKHQLPFRASFDSLYLETIMNDPICYDPM